MNRNPALEAEIFRAPDDPVPYLIYADWLSEHSDPLGQLIALECGPPGADDARVQLLRQAEVRAAMGVVPLPEDCRLTWQRGFVTSVRLRRTRATTPPLWPMLEELLAARCGAFVRGVDVALSQFGETTRRFSEALVAGGRPPLLERLVLRGAGPGDAPALRAAFPRLTELEILEAASLELVALGPARCPTLEVGQRLALSPFVRNVVGRRGDAFIVLAHDRINRSNFTVALEGGSWRFSHLGGTNDILFNGARTHGQHVLKHGDRIEPIEGLVLRFVDPP